MSGRVAGGAFLVHVQVNLLADSIFSQSIQPAFFKFYAWFLQGLCFHVMPCSFQLVPIFFVKNAFVTRGSWGVARFYAKWGIKLVQATLIPLARSYFPFNCEQAVRQIFGLSCKSGLIIGHRNTSLLVSIS